jgi:hypothetical protein
MAKPLQEVLRRRKRVISSDEDEAAAPAPGRVPNQGV